MVSFVKVAFIWLKFMVGIVEPCQEVGSLEAYQVYRLGTAGL